MSSGKVKCTCGWSWNKSDSSKKDMYICHECGRDNSNNMKNGGWLDNYNDSEVSLPEGYVGEGYDTSGRDYSPAWGGQFEDGGLIPMAQNGTKKPLYVKSYDDPKYQAYQDSLSLYEAYKNVNNIIKKNIGNFKNKTTGKPISEKEKKFLKVNKVTYNKNNVPLDILNKRGNNSVNPNIKPVSYEKYVATIPEEISFFGNPSDKLLYDTGILVNYKKPQQEVIVKPTTTKETTKSKPITKPQQKEVNVKPQLQPRVEALNLRPIEQSPINIPVQELDFNTPIKAPKSYNVNMQRYNMQGPSDYYQANEEGVDYQRAMEIKAASDAYNKYIQEKYGNEDALKNPKAVERLKQLKQNVEVTPQYQMGGSIPGSVGFTYARTNSPAPSNGKYAKKTMASAKDGEVIKDDRGQWNHPGEITEIGSNQITMQGVPYPVLGVSDEGDVQMMYPEEEYKFIGKKVTEFPMAKNGIRQEQKGLVNLDNLLNFTNYNTKQSSGWLDQYQ